jgi:hypothetical protein
MMVCQRSIYLIPANPHDIYLSQEIKIIFTYNCNSSLCSQHLVIIFFNGSSQILVQSPNFYMKEQYF